MVKQLLLNGLATGAGYSLLGIGFYLFFMADRFLNIAAGASYLLAAYSYFTLRIAFEVAHVPSGVVAVLIGSGWAIAQRRIVVLPLRRRGTTASGLLLGTLGLLIAIQAATAAAFGTDWKGLAAAESGKPYMFLGAVLQPVQLAYIICASALGALIWLVLSHTFWGTQLRACASDSSLAAVLGIPAWLVGTAAVALGGFVLGIAGILTLYDQGVEPIRGFEASLTGVVTMIVGGTKSLPPILLSGVVIGLLQQMILLVLPSQWQTAIIYAALIVVLAARRRELRHEFWARAEA